jgi:hypothetical protein
VIDAYSKSITTTLPLTLWLLSAWCALSTAEWIANFYLFNDNGVLSWRLLALRHGKRFRSSWSPFIFSRTSIGVALSCRLVASATLCFFPPSAVVLFALVTIVASCFLLTLRTGYGGDGSDQMGCIVTIGACLMTAGVIVKQPWLSLSGTILIGGQLTISYFISGLSKLLSATWRRGRSLSGIMSTYTYGHSLAVKPLNYRACAIAVCWIVITSETMFPCAILAPHRWMVAILACFFLFHLGNAFFMGLNSFVWSFTATYPCILLLNSLARLTLKLAE